MKSWHFNVLFCVGVGGAVFLLFAPDLGLSAASNPTATAGVGLILAYVLTQKKDWVDSKKSVKEEVDVAKEKDNAN